MRLEHGKTSVDVDAGGLIAISQGEAGTVIVDADEARWLQVAALPAAVAAALPPAEPIRGQTTIDDFAPSTASGAGG